MAGPIITAMPKRAMAMPCSWGGKVWRRMACSVGWSAPAPNPWMARKATSDQRLVARPHSAEPTRNSTRLTR